MNTGVTGSDDITPVNDIIDGKMMLQKKGFSFFNIHTQVHTINPLKQWPETILRVSVKEAVFSRFDRRKRTQNQDFRIGLEKRSEWMGNGLMFGHCRLTMVSVFFIFPRCFQ